MLLELKNVEKIYNNGTKALKNVSFTVNKGEFVSVIGSSGSGKSTLLRTINRMIDITNGEIKFLTEDDSKNEKIVEISKLKKGEINKVRRQIGMIFQNYNLVEKLTVIENVLHGRLGYKSTLKGILGIYNEDEKREAFELLERVDMAKYAYTKCSELSGGQKQRVGIARALMQKPRLLLCDEPIASLDPKTSEIVMDYIKKIVDEMKITCIVNLHQVDIAKKYSNRIIALNNGEKIFDNTVNELNEDMIKKIYSSDKKVEIENAK